MSELPNTDYSGEQLLDVHEVAEMLHVSEWTVYQEALKGTIPRVKLFGRMVRFRLQDIVDLIEAQHG